MVFLKGLQFVGLKLPGKMMFTKIVQYKVIPCSMQDYFAKEEQETH